MSNTRTFDGAEIDGGLLNAIVNFAHAHPGLKWFFLFLSHAEVPILLIFMLIAWYLAQKKMKYEHRHAGRWDSRILAQVYALPIVIVLAYLCNLVVKKLVHELRPCRSLSNPYISECPKNIHNYAFPSSHAILAMSCAIGLYWISKRLSVIAVVIGILICFSRLYLGAHYPHDVLVGAILGALIAYFIGPRISVLLDEKFLQRRMQSQ